MKKVILMMVLALGMCSINGSAQTKKQSTTKRATTSRSTNSRQGGQVMKFRQVGNDGYIWLKLKRGNLYGVRDDNGNTIIPIKYDDIIYCCEEGKNYFIVNSNGCQGIYSIEGDYIIKTDKGYKKIELWVNNTGEAAIWYAEKREYSDIDIYDTRGKFVFHGWDADMNEYTKYNSEKLDITLFYQVNDSSVFRHYHESDFGPEFSFTPYKSIFKGITPSNTSSSSSSSSSSNNNSGNKKTTVVVEHHRDPIPVQEWQTCTNCWGEGRVMCGGACGGTGTYYAGDRLYRCSSCGGTGKKICPYCGGQGGKNVTVYR